jgi:uncharacterized protein YyaL (SSP411 family)
MNGDRLQGIGYSAAMNTDTSSGNRLDQESSPYLRQHAHNPVDWHPWDQRALDLARDTGRPILLSIGYSACHWCHVMAHESFEDDATARLMNEKFVNIKVDREERPDIDRIYQTAHQLLTQRAGGWPLTMFLSPEDQRPFFGGTYFPDKPRHGMPAFADVIQRVALFYDENADDIRRQGQQLMEVFARIEPAPGDEQQELTAAPLTAAREKLAQTFDSEWGGFGSAPKFPHPSTIERLLRHWRGTATSPEPDVEALFMVSLTLTRMAEGGLFDHLGGGFCRYSVDRYWQIPHFEKMLYDNGPLLALYAQAWAATGEASFRRIAIATGEWMLDDMQAPGGAFYAARDADSEGAEGRYYVWRPEEVQSLVDAQDYEVVARHFGLDADANFEGDWHLAVREPIEAIAADTETPADELLQKIERARAALLAARQTRIPPARDEKQLASWNALAIRGLSIAGRSLDRKDFVSAASEAADFIAREMFVDDRLLASHMDNVSRFPAYLDDHAFLLDALLELLQANWNTHYLRLAVRLAEQLLERFYDAGQGGFYFTADDAEPLIHRSKSLADEALPSGNGIAAIALQRLGFLLGEARYLDAAEKTLRAAWQAMLEYPHGHVSLITALEEYLASPEIIIIRGEESEIARWRDAAAKLYAPRRLVFAIPADEEDLPGALSERAADGDRAIAYRCVGSHCSLPITSFEALAADLGED